MIKTPYYFGGMILSNFDEAYSYENWLVNMLQHRYEKYKVKWSFLVGMEILMKNRMYAISDFHIVPEDPLIHIPEELLYWRCLSLKRRKLTILEFEVMKFYRRKKVYPVS